MYIHNRNFIQNPLAHISGFPLPTLKQQKFVNNCRIEVADINGNYRRFNMYKIEYDDNGDISNISTLVSPDSTMNGDEYDSVVINSITGSDINSIIFQYPINETSNGIVLRLISNVYDSSSMIDYVLFEFDTPDHIPLKAIGGFYYTNYDTRQGISTAYFTLPDQISEQLQNLGDYVDCRLTLGTAEITPFNVEAYIDDHHLPPEVVFYTDVDFVDGYGRQLGQDIFNVECTSYPNLYHAFSLYVRQGIDLEDFPDYHTKTAGKEGTIYRHSGSEDNDNALRHTRLGNTNNSIAVMTKNVRPWSYGVGGTINFSNQLQQGLPKLIIVNGQILGYNQNGLTAVDGTILKRDCLESFGSNAPFGASIEIQCYYTASVAEYVYNKYQQLLSLNRNGTV